MSKQNNAGFLAITLVIVIALIAVAGAYYAGSQNTKQEVENNPSTTNLNPQQVIISTSSTAVTPTPIVASNKKLYTSNIFGIQFEYPTQWYVHEKLAFGSDISFVNTATRPKELTESCDCDGDLYYPNATINVVKSGMSKDVTEQMIAEENKKNIETFPPALKMAKEAGVTLGKFLYVNKNGLKVVRQYGFSELNDSRINVIYYVYTGDKIYQILGAAAPYNRETDAILRDIAGSFKVIK